MRAQRGPATERGLRQMGYHYPFLLITGSVCRDWLPSPKLLGRAAVPAILEGRNGLSFSSMCISSQLPLRPQTFLAQCGPWGTGPGGEMECAAATCPRRPGEGLAQSRRRGSLSTRAGA